jgi:hypothetical protein
MRQRGGSRFSNESSDSFSLQDDDSVFDIDEYHPSDTETDPTDNSDVEFDFNLQDACPPNGSITDRSSNSYSQQGNASAFDTNKPHLLDMNIDSISQLDSESSSDSDIYPLDNCTLSSDYFLQIEDKSDDDDADQTAFSSRILKQLDGIERRWQA